MSSEEKADYVKYRLDTAHATLAAARVLMNNSFWNSALNRLYYAAFYAINALLVTHNIQTKSHSSTKIMFSQHFVKTNRFDKKWSTLFAKLFDSRQKGDYENLFDYTEDLVEPLFQPVEEFIALIEQEIKNYSK